jgi:hypothetical protein
MKNGLQRRKKRTQKLKNVKRRKKKKQKLKQKKTKIQT